MPNGKPWYKKNETVILAVLAILAAIIGVSWDYWLRPPSPDFIMSINPMIGQVQPGGVIATAITVKSENGYKESVSLSGSGQPPGMIPTFVPPIGGTTPWYTSTLTISINSDVPVGKYEILIKGLGSDGKEHSVTYTLNIMPKDGISITPLPSPSPTPSSVVIKIISPKEGEGVTVPILVSGTVLGDLQEGQYMWVVVSPSGSQGQWWPQIGRIVPWEGQWNTQTWIGRVNGDIGMNSDIAVILVNEKDNQYYTNYIENGSRNGSFPGIPLPPSAKIMDRITVVRI